MCNVSSHWLFLEPGQSNVPDVTGYLSQGDVVSFTTDHAGVHNGFQICFTVTQSKLSCFLAFIF